MAFSLPPRPKTINQAAIGIGAAAGAGAVLGYALTGQAQPTLEFALGGGLLYGGAVGLTFGYDEATSKDWDHSWTAAFFGGELSATEVFLNPFHGGVAGHAAHYAYEGAKGPWGEFKDWVAGKQAYPWKS